jgi:serine protease AprX
MVMQNRTLMAMAAAILLLPALSGCVVGGQARTEWAFDITELSAAAAAGHTGQGVTVAILDTGINVRHNALKHLADGRMDNGELVAFEDYVNGHSGVANAYDDEGHGSHVSGIIAAEGSSLTDKITYGGISLLGGAPHVRLVVAKVCSAPTEGQPQGSCNVDAIPQAINWAVDQHARIISLSLGSEGAVRLLAKASPQEQALQKAVSDAVAKGVVVVAAAGNAGPDNTDVSTPADIPEVLSVGAIQSDGTVWSNSSRGDDAGNPCRPTTSPPPLPIPLQQTTVPGRCDPDKKPELVAPGVDILSAWTGDLYVRARGTSQATPFVTAAVALLLEGRPPLAGRDAVLHLKQVLEQTARPAPDQSLPHDRAAGYGIVQAMRALDAYRP